MVIGNLLTGIREDRHDVALLRGSSEWVDSRIARDSQDPCLEIHASNRSGSRLARRLFDTWPHASEGRLRELGFRRGISCGEYRGDEDPDVATSPVPRMGRHDSEPR